MDLQPISPQPPRLNWSTFLSSPWSKLIGGIVVFAVVGVAIWWLIGGYWGQADPPVLPEADKRVDQSLGLDSGGIEEVPIDSSSVPINEPLEGSEPFIDPAPSAVADERDSDQDGLPDVVEEVFGTDPQNPDTDGDGYSDGEEVINGYDPLGPGKTLLY